MYEVIGNWGCGGRHESRSKIQAGESGGRGDGCHERKGYFLCRMRSALLCGRSHSGEGPADCEYAGEVQFPYRCNGLFSEGSGVS